ncbi:EAL domain-containing protein (putative c-di-GMP-specific phosphodiesterase class I) [Rhizobium aquaticum]|uniref:EAL domain-containing protein (Putative c-di-GMP-specific phosphodiesterase class I) n=1 Tax=Rhizobium aquaticum TaxID=1549636 RepID=A0ABV2J0P8_9HYPH
MQDKFLDHLTLHYQPQMTADGQGVAAAEALLRVAQPTGDFTNTADVLAYVEKTDQVEVLDWWIAERACRDALRWPGLSIGINLSAGRFRDPNFAPRFIAMVKEIGVPATQIELEIVESSYIEDFETANLNINALRAAKIRIALDDFGTGFSSLTYLLKMPVDKLKIDKSFVDGLGDLKSTAIVHAVVALARAVGLKITAEGIENEHQWKLLKLAGCHYMQGWHFYKAMDPDALTALLSEFRIVKPF